MPEPFAEYLKIAFRYADTAFEKMVKAKEVSFKDFQTIEKMVMEKKDDYSVDFIKNYPQFVLRLGEMIYQAKYSPIVLRGEKKSGSYFEFEWYVLAEEIVLSLSFFEAFITKTVEIICKASIDTMKDFLRIKNTGIDLSKKKVFDKQLNKVFQKISGKSIERRLMFLNNHCDLKIPIDEKRMKGLIFFEQIRHLIVHRNGIVDKEYFRKTRKLGLSPDRESEGIGKKYLITKDYAKVHRHITSFFASELYVNVNRKYFGLQIK